VSSRSPAREAMDEYIRENRNWGRWGENDEIGALNMVTAEKRLQAARLVRTGRLVSLSRPVPIKAGPNNLQPVQHFMKRLPRGETGGSAEDFVMMGCHGTSSTHMDALCHVWAEDGMWNGRDPDREITFDGASFGDINQMGGGVITRGVLLDVTQYRGVPYVTYDEPVHASELKAVAAASGTVIEPGDAVAVHCGRERWDRENMPWGSGIVDGPVFKRGEVRAGLHTDCIQFLRDVDASVLLWDMMDLYPNDLGMPFSVHTAIWAFCIVLIDNCLLEPLVDACTEEQRSDFLVSLAPLRLVGGTGSPVNPLALM
jgi:kynurenine formamidase